MKEEITAAVDVPQNTMSTKFTDFINFGNVAKNEKTLVKMGIRKIFRKQKAKIQANVPEK